MIEQRESSITRDGSSTLYSTRFEQHYHSIHGAVQESQHVFLDMGFKAVQGDHPIRILEMGFGTGLNALMTCLQSNRPVSYLALEAYPLTPEEWSQVNYGHFLKAPTLLKSIHQAEWGTNRPISDLFSLEKVPVRCEDFTGSTGIDLVYWDAFAPAAQPELWTADLFRRVRSWMSPGGILTTYSAKGDVRRALMTAGFDVEKLPGPPGKREMLRATSVGKLKN